MLIVGPNNSGKSLALREIHRHLAPPHERPTEVVIGDLSVACDFSVADLVAWLKQYYPVEPMESGFVRLFLPGGQNPRIRTEQGLEEWLRSARSTLIQRLDTESRLTYANPAQPIDVYRRAPEAPIHFLQRYDSLSTEVSEIVESAFGESLIINWGAGSAGRFHYGKEPVRDAANDRVSQRYLEGLNKLPQLHELGDGIRSFVASVLAAKTGGHPVLLIDEPEAFLYPTQAWRLGWFLSSEVKDQNRQAIIATHSPDVIKGALQGSKCVTICRIERKGNVNNACILDTDRLRDLWSTPLLRSSQAITGLFHEGVVVCEADSDCRFYEAVVDTVDGTLSKPTDLHFAHGGGKGALASLAKAYVALSIKTAVIADLDLLKSGTEFFAVYESLGGDRTEVDTQYRRVSNALGSQGPIRAAPEFVTATREVLEEIQGENQVNSSHKRRIQGLLDEAGDWSQAKRYGIERLRGGENTAATAFLETCKKHGLFLVPKGELEGWWKAGPADKGEWTVAALAELSKDPGAFAGCKQFVRELCAYFGY